MSLQRKRHSLEGLARPALLAVLAAVALMLAVSLSLIRWDAKTLGEIQPRGENRELVTGRAAVVVTSDESLKSWHLMEYGIDLVTFPSGRAVWVVFRENALPDWNQGRPPAAMIDSAGVFYTANGKGAWLPTTGVPGVVTDALRDGALLVPTGAVRDELLRRWRTLDSSKVTVLSEQTPSRFRRPALAVNGSQAARLLLFCLSLALLGRLVVLTRRSEERGLALCFVLPLWLALHSTLVSVIGTVASDSMAWAFVIEIIVLGVACVLFAPVSEPIDARSPEGVRRMSAGSWTCLTIAIVYVAVTMFRRDFDGDVFTHWLPMAASLHRLGHHDPAVLLQRYGDAHQANYPPGFPLFLSTMMWIGQVPRGANLVMGPAGSVAIFMTRLCISLLHLAFLAALFLEVRGLRGRAGVGLAAAATLSVALAIPLLLGRATAAEVYLVPMLGFAMLAIARGVDGDDQESLCAGLFLAAFGLLIKNEALVIVTLVVLPWYVAGVRLARRDLGRTAWQGIAFAAGLVPFVVWSMSRVHRGHGANFGYYPVTLHGLIAGLPRLGGFAEFAFKILLADNLWFVFLAFLPAALVWHLGRRLPWRRLFVPVGIYLHLAAMVVIYIFSRADPYSTMDLAYERTVLVAALSALLFGFRLLAASEREHGG